MKVFFSKNSVFLFVLICLSFNPSVAQEYSYQATTILKGGTQPIDDGLAMDQAGNVYGAYWGIWQGAAGTHILRYQPKLGRKEVFVEGLQRPNGMSYHNGKLYFSTGGVDIMSADQEGNTELVAKLTGLSNVIPVPGTTDSLIAISWGNNSVSSISPNGIKHISSAGLLNGPVGACFDPDGNLYVANFNNGRILKIEADGSQNVFSSFEGGIGFICYSQNAILATNHDDNKVYHIPIETGTPSAILGNGLKQTIDGVDDAIAFAGPNGIIASPSGDTIFISEFQGKALRMITRSLVTSAKGVENEKLAINVYPLPAKDQIFIELSQLSSLNKVQLYNMNGQLLQSFPWEDAQLKDSIDISTFANGQYQLRFLDALGTQLKQQTISILK